MDNFTAIYVILAALEKAMDVPDFDLEQIGHTELEMSKERWSKYIEMMADAGYIKGVTVKRNVLGQTSVEDNGVQITLKGLEYLRENSTMQKIHRTMKGIKESTPFL